MRIALAMTVKNESRLLRGNLLYHHHFGVERAYVYLDPADEGSDASIADLAFVDVRSSVSPSTYAGHALLERAVSAHSHIATARQTLNAHHAAETARRDGFDWLIAIDADELLCLRPRRQPRGALKRRLAAVPRFVEQIVFPPVESMQRSVQYTDVLREEQLFLRPSLRAKPLFDPLLGRVHRHRGLLGHTSGKSVVRLDRGLIPIGAHRFRRPTGGRPITTRMGLLLHYNNFDFHDFLKKNHNFGNNPPYYLSGDPVEYVPKRMWRELVSCGAYDTSYLRDYFVRWVMFSEEEVARLRRPRLLSRSAVVEVTAVARALSRQPRASTGSEGA